MKKNRFARALALSVSMGLLVLAGCDNPADADDGNWLAKEQNPFIGTWGYSSTNMMSGVTTEYELEFKTDGTIAGKTTSSSGTTNDTRCYLVKDKFLVVSGTGNTVYVKYLFEVIDNNHIKLVQDTGGTINYTRTGAENPNASRTLVLANGFDGYWRRDDLTSSATMYDWYTFNKNGTYHVYHWMNNDKHYIDRGEYGYFIDGSNRLVSLSRGYTVTVYYDVTKSGENAFSWKTASGGNASGFNRFNGENFAIE